MRLLFYAAVIALIFVLIRKILSAQNLPQNKEPGRFRFRAKPDTHHAWVQVYDTDSLEEIKSLQARLEEEEIECFIYEQGRKDIHGNQLKGYGIAVPRTSVAHAQKVIARMPA